MTADEAVDFRSRLVSAARSYLGTKFEHQGRTRNGIDCVGLIVNALNDAGYNPVCRESIEKRDYHRVPSSTALTDRISAECDYLAVGPSVADYACENALPGDLLVMSYKRDEKPKHVALVSSGTGKDVRIIHTNNETGMVKEHLLFPTYSLYVVALCRWKCLRLEA